MDYLRPEDFFTMVPEVKAQWLEDLRSGQIPQTTKKLHRVDGSMCCLGVLSKRAAEEDVVSVYTSDDVFTYNGLVGTLAQETCQWAGLVKNSQGGRTSVTAAGLLPFDDRQDRAVYLDGLNDSGFTFDQIADLIECFY